jgi:large subunit ribosomal protein L6
MSRIGNAPITLPEGVEINISADNLVVVKGKLGELEQAVNPGIKVSVDEGIISVSRSNDDKEMRSMHGLYRALINNMVEGVSKGYVKEQELVGVGYRAKASGKLLELSLGFSHPVKYQLPDEVSVETPSQTEVVLSSHNKQALGQAAAEIRAFRPPEPYKGKGILYENEIPILKEGKKA